MVSLSHRRTTLAWLLVIAAVNTSTHAFAPPSQPKASWSLFQSTAATDSTSAPSTMTTTRKEMSDESVDDLSSTDENKSELQSYSLDLSKTIYTSSIKSPKDSYIAFAEKGAANAKMPKRKIFHQSLLGGCYVGFGALVALSVAGNIPGLGDANPGLVKMVFASLFPVNLLMILTTGGQLFTGNSATVAAARYENLVGNKELIRSWVVSLAGNVVGCSLMALAAWYAGCLTGGAANLCAKMAVGKVGTTPLQNFAKAIMCNWMVSLAVFLGGATNNLGAKLIAVWFPISLFVAIGLEHSVANLFLMPAAMLIKASLSWNNIIFRNVLPVLAGNAIAGAIVVALSYSYQFGRVGGKQRAVFAEKLAQREKKSPMVEIASLGVGEAIPTPVTLEEAATQKEDGELEQKAAEAMEDTVNHTTQQEVTLQKERRVEAEAVLVDAATEEAAMATTELKNVAVVSLDELLTRNAATMKESRELRQMEAAATLRSAQITEEASSLKKARELKQIEAAAALRSTQMTEEASLLKKAREMKQMEADGLVRRLQMEKNALMHQREREWKQAEAARMIMVEERKSSNTTPTKNDLDSLTAKYAAIEDLGERVYQILNDLGSFQYS